MSLRETLFTRDDVAALIAQGHPTPFYIYDERGIRAGARRLQGAFRDSSAFKNFFAVKALPNPHILRILKEEGMGADCSSMAELLLAERAGFQGEEVMFTSNNTPAAEFAQARAQGAIINFDDLKHLNFYKKNVGQLPTPGCARFNPGSLKKGGRTIGNPIEAKFGATREQIFEMYKRMHDAGVDRFGIHTMVISNCLDPAYLAETTKILFELIKEVRDQVGITMEFANLGGGFGIPYKPEEQPLQIEAVAEDIERLYDEIIIGNGHPPLQLFMENGRWVTGPHGYLVTGVRHVTEKYRRFAGVDASMANLMRPGMYGAYHHMTVLGKEDVPPTQQYTVTGGLCEGNDIFAENRMLPPLEEGDVIVMHDTGAHGHAMGFQYNGNLRSAEFLCGEDGSYTMIRRAETVDDYFATLV